jgi:creatinine amidohydrolase
MSAPSPLPRYWAHLRSPQFARLDADRTVAVLPLAATEQHGPHLPLSVDTDLLEGLIAHTLPRLSADLPVLLLPTQTVGRSIEHEAFAGTLTVESHALIEHWLDLGRGVARAGVKKLVLLNSHGGNASTMDIVGRQLRARHGLTVLMVNTYQLRLPAQMHALFSEEEHRFGAHGGDIETSMMLALHPDRVDMSQAHSFVSASRDRAARYSVLGDGQSAKLAWAVQDLHASGAAGNASAATAEKGRAVLLAASEVLAQLLVQACDLQPEPRLG